MFSYTELRKKYPEFVYRGYEIEESADRVGIVYDLEIPGLASFRPTWEFPKRQGEQRCFKENGTFQKLVFSLGMVELISYWKTACPPVVKVEAGSLTEEQCEWWKDLYFNGLGEFYYTNGIREDQQHFMEIRSLGAGTAEPDMPLGAGAEGYLIPVGGGKDSAVTLSLLEGEKEKNCCYIINPRGATLKTVERAGYGEDQLVTVKRTLDKNMLELNRQGYLNGHTPYSAIVAFSATIAAYMRGVKYIALSNESSANESTVEGSTVNHQYSKSFRFEKAFHDYEAAWIGSGTYYFSMLRPLSEFQIARYFAKCRQFHDIFRSCNAGSKEDKWCGHCPKCLFVYLILSPFLAPEKLQEIFGREMLEDETLLPVMDQLIGIREEKPFECVGSRSEINTAITLAIEKLTKEGRSLPKLFVYYKTTALYGQYKEMGDTYSGYFDSENLLPEKFEKLVRSACVQGRPEGGSCD